MGFKKNFETDPLGERIYVLVHGEPKIGKTRMVLDLVKKQGDYVVMLSMDKGTLAVRQEPHLYKGKLTIAEPDGLREIRSDMKEAQTIVGRLVRGGVARSKIWVVLDTVTHLQSKLIAEARKINVKNPSSKDSREDFVRDAVIEVDWGINLAHMSEVADFLTNVKANVVVLSLSKKERSGRNETGRHIPSISGQSYTRLLGDADVILHMKEDAGERFLSLGDAGSLGGDRSGRLGVTEPANLKHIQQKMIGVQKGTENRGADGTPAQPAPHS